MCPVDIQFTKISYEALKEAYATADKDSDDYEKTTKILEDSKLSISDTLKNNGFDVDEYLKNMTEYSVYQTGLEEMDTLGILADEICEKYQKTISKPFGCHPFRCWLVSEAFEISAQLTIELPSAAKVVAEKLVTAKCSEYERQQKINHLSLIHI